MKTSWMFRTQILAVVLGWLFCANAIAQEKHEDKSLSAEELKQVRADLAEVKTELKAVRRDLQRVLSELRAVKAARQDKPKRKPRPPDTTVYDIKIGDSPIRGPKDAPVTIVEYVCFQCPFCAKEAPVLKQVLDAYPKDVRLVFKHFPLGFHKKAKPAHAAAALAYKQKGNEGFWKMYDLIEADYKKIDIPDLRAHAELLGMDLKEFDEVMADPAKIDALLQKDLTEAKAYKVRGTPSVYINGLKLSPRGFNNYKARIDAILKGEDKTKEQAKPKAELKPMAKFKSTQ